jgi:hypothetical protein
VQTTLQPWSATIYHSILHYGLQPSITFLELPASLCRNAVSSFPANSGGDPSFPASADSYGFGSYGGRAAENAASTTYEAVRVHFAAELLMLGFIRKQQLTLNPHEGSRLVPGDVLVALSKRADGKLCNDGYMYVLGYDPLGLALRHCMPVTSRPHYAKCSSCSASGCIVVICAVLQPLLLRCRGAANGCQLHWGKWQALSCVMLPVILLHGFHHFSCLRCVDRPSVSSAVLQLLLLR